MKHLEAYAWNYSEWSIPSGFSTNFKMMHVAEEFVNSTEGIFRRGKFLFSEFPASRQEKSANNNNKYTALGRIYNRA